ncbi:DNA-3-methyladenine glycosylase [Bifidobacterium sp. ESL0798]|uniref:DNA-3-methyladenine glycosylase n=1 Tax=unclassified Bifidobacterium TaxID=2608897 RepID=UPI0023F8F195|nr:MULTISPECIES: DNA-3-methyladenine glycosylase [unclassified Bifidobacterium]WEV52832.1 DNA-3-methyladenine glycosylase [Bifidobacterium sp. ESL0704]WEV74182.1 DNA-3-methyladenine glycosylase [Bifidobacterium sp. ESL0798]
MFPAFLNEDAETVARRLLGCTLAREIDGETLTVRIVETEAYDQLDPASHTFHGKSERNRAMFGPSGHAYIYLVYGTNLCMNVTAFEEGFGAGALIRAAEPMDMRTAEIIEERRGGRRIKDCLNGPGKICKSLGITMDLYGHDLRTPPLKLEAGSLRSGERVETTQRIGITKAKDRPRRFIIAGNPYLSR